MVIEVLVCTHIHGALEEKTERIKSGERNLTKEELQLATLNHKSSIAHVDVIKNELEGSREKSGVQSFFNEKVIKSIARESHDMKSFAL